MATGLDQIQILTYEHQIKILQDKLKFAERQVLEREQELDHYKHLASTLQGLLFNQSATASSNNRRNNDVNATATNAAAASMSGQPRRNTASIIDQVFADFGKDLGPETFVRGGSSKNSLLRASSGTSMDADMPPTKVGSIKGRKCVSFHDEPDVMFFDPSSPNPLRRYTPL